MKQNIVKYESIVPYIIISAILFLSVILILPSESNSAGPVEWHEVPSTEAGRQWWDEGSLKRNKTGTINVLSRFQASNSKNESKTVSKLYVMEIDCAEKLFKDSSINGLPNFSSRWVEANGDKLIDSVINEVCSATIT